MQTIKRTIALGFAALLLTCWSSSSYAESPFREIFQDVFYGGLTGAVVGGAFLAFTKKPSQHLDYLGYGAAGGILAGAAYGMVKTARSLAEVENGKVKFAVPTIKPEFMEASSRVGETHVVWHAELVRGKF